MKYWSFEPTITRNGLGLGEHLAEEKKNRHPIAVKCQQLVDYRHDRTEGLQALSTMNP